MLCQITTSDLKVAYGEFVALDCSSMTLSGNTIAFLGHNGAGKSTFIKCLLRLLPPHSGDLKVSLLNDGLTTEMTPEKHMAFCPESGSVFEDITVEDYVELWCRIKHRDARYYRKGGSRVIEMLNLAPLMGKLGRELSKGQRRRVQTAIGYLTKPLLFLFDEPFDGLDVQKTSELADIMCEHASSMCSIISSHRMDVVERVADSVVVLQEGKVAALGPVDQVSLKLCRQSVLVRNLSDCAAMQLLVKEHFRSSIVCHIGNQLTVTGADFELEDLVEFIKAKDKNTPEIEEIQPSLTDAMNYHLKKIDWKNLRVGLDLESTLG